VLAAARCAPGAAEAVTGRLDAVAAFAQRDYMTSHWHDDRSRSRLDCSGIELVRGTGRLTGDRAVEVQGADGATLQLSAARAVVLATGSGREFTGDEILVAVGRRPATVGMGLEHAGLEAGRAVTVDEHMPRRGSQGCASPSLLRRPAMFQAPIPRVMTSPAPAS